MFDSVGSLLGTLPKRGKLNGALAALSVRRAFDMALRDVCQDLPLQSLDKVKAKSFKDGVLLVSCQGLIIGELSMRSASILKFTNAQLGKRIVIKLRFKAG
jgi:hypothetical protein